MSILYIVFDNLVHDFKFHILLYCIDGKTLTFQGHRVVMAVSDIEKKADNPRRTESNNP